MALSNGADMKSEQRKEFVLLSGLPRTGSTLLISLLMQNPSIYGEGASALCQLMWDMKCSCEQTTALLANNKTHTQHEIISSLPYLYYKHVDQPIVIEKGRAWVHPTNLDMWNTYVNKNQKVIVMVRPAEEIVKSLVSLRKKNNWRGDLYSDLLRPNSEPIYKAAEAIAYSRFIPSDKFLYIDYRDLVDEPLEVLDLIYDFLGLQPYNHQIDNIEQFNCENDSVHGLLGMHDVRPQIASREVDVELPDHVLEACEKINMLVYGEQVFGEWSLKLDAEVV